MWGLCRLLLWLCLLDVASPWVQWNYYTEWAIDGTAEKARGLEQSYYLIWNSNSSVGSTPRPGEAGTQTTNCPPGQTVCPKTDGSYRPDQNAPRPRRGHSMVILDTPTLDPIYQGYTYVIMFGGRDNDNASYVHIPKTYKVVSINGSISFATYDQYPVDPCNDLTGQWYTPAEIAAANCNSGPSRSKITVGIIYNDVWAYKMCARSPEPPSTPSFSSPYTTPYTKVPTSKATPGPTGPGLDPSQRIYDQPCDKSGWVLLHPGAQEGGCTIQLGILVCTVPSERYNHGSVIFNDGTMYVYGGFSQRCVDYCDDLWFFDVFMKAWRQVYCTDPTNCQSDLSRLYTDKFSTWTNARYHYGNDPDTGLPMVPLMPNTSIDSKPQPWAGPSKRWRFPWVASTKYYECRKPNPPDATGRGETGFARLSWGDTCDTEHKQCCQDSAIFGGHRLWQGYDEKNSEGNNWENYDLRPPGGYLDDLWIYTKFLDFKTTNGESFHNADGIWRYVWPKSQTEPDFDVNNWANRNRYKTFTIWPSERAGHGLAYDDVNNLLWMHGGYATYFPYLSTDGEGSGPGPQSVGIGGFVPYPGYNYFRDDLWYFNLSNDSTTGGIWTQVPFAPGDAVPAARADHVFLFLGEVLFLHGGFADNYYFDDTWYFNITTHKWLQKKRFTNPIYPKTCVDDWKYINSPEGQANCIKNQWPLHLSRSQSLAANGLPAENFEIIPFVPPDFVGQSGVGPAVAGQNYYWPDQRHGPYFPPVPANFVKLPQGYQLKVDVEGGFPERETSSSNPRWAANIPLAKMPQPAIGDPEFPFSAVGPLEYARPFKIILNSTYNATVYMRCTSVFGEPTRGRVERNLVLDSNFVPINLTVFVPQPRRQAPGWDGCRDRADGRNDGSLPMELQYYKPTGRSQHRAVWYKDMNEIIMYGGVGYLEEQPVTANQSWPTVVHDDMWYYNIFHCNNKCSGHGVCYYGFCQCYVGYYGEDCSNTSCPGTACYYDDYTHDQVCLHACQAGYIHKGNDSYVQDIAKLPCNPEPAYYNPGEVNGICDGFGTAQCSPPYLGNDCGTLDCKANCSFNGWCSVEYPVSRCMCQAGYYGDVCQYRLCLNNCSYPNGVCNSTTGRCECRWTYSPYNNTRPYKPWDGEDCSWLWAYAAGHPASRFGLAHAYLALVLGVALSSLLASQTQGQGQGQGQGHTQGQGRHKTSGLGLDPDPDPDPDPAFSST